jgi:hypothetical protein
MHLPIPQSHRCTHLPIGSGCMVTDFTGLYTSCHLIGIVFAHGNKRLSPLFGTRQFILIIARSSRAGNSFSNCAGSVGWMCLGGLMIWGCIHGLSSGGFVEGWRMSCHDFMYILFHHLVLRREVSTDRAHKRPGRRLKLPRQISVFVSRASMVI